MYLRSMRREVYCIARDHNIPILTVLVDIPTEIAIQRNQARDELDRVPAESMQRLLFKFESPLSIGTVGVYDRNVCQIQGNDEIE